MIVVCLEVSLRKEHTCRKRDTVTVDELFLLLFRVISLILDCTSNISNL